MYHTPFLMMIEESWLLWLSFSVIIGGRWLKIHSIIVLIKEWIREESNCNEKLPVRILWNLAWMKWSCFQLHFKSTNWWKSKCPLLLLYTKWDFIITCVHINKKCILKPCNMCTFLWIQGGNLARLILNSLYNQSLYKYF